MAQGKRSGGPNSSNGKLRSSKNATSHGLTSMVPTNSTEKALVDAFVKELVDYYKPESPLEQLQIQRIAICRAKLAYLYELEQVKLSLAIKELESHPEKILEKIPGAIGLALGMARECIVSGDMNLPLRLDWPLLQAICDEINNMPEGIQNKHQFARALPRLTKYLNAYPVFNLNNIDQWMEKLAAVSNEIEMAEEVGVKQSSQFDEVARLYFLGKEYEEQLKEEAMRPQMEELERHQEERRIERGEKPRKIESTPTVDPNIISDMDAIWSQLKQFLWLRETYEKAQEIAANYEEMKNLMLKAVSFPAAESDLLMRYQTTLERRLSSAIGELLALQRNSRV